MEQQASSYVLLAGSSTVRLRPNGKEYATGLPPEQTFSEKLQSALYDTIRKLYAEGHRDFRVTLEEGFGLEAANLIQMVRENNTQCPGIRLQVYYVYDGQQTHYDGLARALFEDIVKRSDSAEACFRGILPTREQYQAMQHDLTLSLVSGCCLLVCYDDATQEPVTTIRNRAQKAGIPVLNLYDELNKKHYDKSRHRSTDH